MELSTYQQSTSTAITIHASPYLARLPRPITGFIFIFTRCTPILLLFPPNQYWEMAPPQHSIFELTETAWIRLA